MLLFLLRARYTSSQTSLRDNRLYSSTSPHAALIGFLSLSNCVWRFDQALLKLVNVSTEIGSVGSVCLQVSHVCINRLWPVTSPTCSYWEWCPSPAAPCLCQHVLPASCQACRRTGCPPPWRCPPGRRPDSEESPSRNQSGFGWKRSPHDPTPVCHYRL